MQEAETEHLMSQSLKALKKDNCTFASYRSFLELNFFEKFFRKQFKNFSLVFGNISLLIDLFRKGMDQLKCFGTCSKNGDRFGHTSGFSKS